MKAFYNRLFNDRVLYNRLFYNRNIATGIFIAAFLFAGLANCKEDHTHHHQSMASATASPGSIYDLELRFTDRTGKAFPLKQLAGKPLVFSMIYTRCDSVCPIQAGNMLRIQQKLPADLQDDVQFMLMSFDAEDSADDLADFGRKLRLDRNWSVLGGPPDRVRELAAAVGFQYRKNPQGDFSHSAAIYLINAAGEVTYKKEGTTGSPADFAAEIAKL